jgi:hypothetical protein
MFKFMFFKEAIGWQRVPVKKAFQRLDVVVLFIVVRNVAASAVTKAPKHTAPIKTFIPADALNVVH